MIRRLLAGYLSVTAFVLLVLGIPLVVLYARNERAQLVNEVRLEATEVAAFAAIPLTVREFGLLQEVASTYGRTTAGRLVVVDRTAVSVADSQDDPGRSFGSRPEVATALRGRETHGFRHSTTLATDLFYVAVPVNSGASVLGAVRITYPASFVEDRIQRSWVVLGAVGVFTVGLVTGVSFVVARSVARPVRELERAAARLGEGDLGSRAEVPDHPPEVRSLASSFNETAAKLERLVEAQQMFVADASHQLRTPLAALRLRLENLEAETVGDAHADAEGALAETMRLARLVDGLLVLARADSQPSAPRDVDVDAVVGDRVGNWSALAAEREVALEVDGHGGHALLTPDSLEQVLDNVIANAIDATPAGTTVRVALQRNRETVDVHVVDEGPGMTREQRERAFTRFVSAKDASGTGGFGLGLTIARRLVVRDRGELLLGEADTGGLDVHLRLPASRH